jgi:hypothetical protein
MPMMRKPDLQNLGKGAGQQTTPREEDNPFADIPVLKNEDFIYPYLSELDRDITREVTGKFFGLFQKT